MHKNGITVIAIREAASRTQFMIEYLLIEIDSGD